MDELVFRGRPLGDWVARLDSTDAAERAAAAAALLEAGKGAGAVLPALVRAMQAAAWEARAAAAATLGEVGTQVLAALPAYRAALRAAVLTDPDTGVRTCALEALGQVGPQPRSRVPELIDALGDELAYVRLNAAYALGELGAEAKAAAGALVPLALRDDDFRVRLEAAVALWRIDRRAAVALPVLTEALCHPDEVLRWLAADCLGDMGPHARPAVPALREALGGQYRAPLIRKGIALAMERIDPDTAAAGVG
jgi:HEAT repeat protein